MPFNNTPPPKTLSGVDVRSILDGVRSIKTNYEEASQTNIDNSGSFLYDVATAGLKSTQQFNVDWSRFENHTFFGSAEVNVNVAFDLIINKFPFDGTKKENEAFFDKLTGFERHVFDRFPKNVGYLVFSGTQLGEDNNGTKGTWISVADYAGGLYPALSKNKTGQGVLDPGTKSFAIEAHVFPAADSNDIQVICQKISGSSYGLTLYLNLDVSSDTAQLMFNVISGTSYLEVGTTIPKGQFTHVCAQYNRDSSLNKLEIYTNGVLAAETTTKYRFGEFGFSKSPFTIATGSSFFVEGRMVTPVQTFSGALDDLRVWHAARSPAQIKSYQRKSVFSSPELKLYYKFNEPTGTLGKTESDEINRIVLDSSGNSLHSLVCDNFTFNLRSTGSVVSPVTYEKLELNPVLFPNFTGTLKLNTDLLTSASLFDQVNPNLITRLVPPHYFLQGQVFEGLESEQGNIGESYTGTDAPRTGKLGSTQLLLSFLYVWAKLFDEIKIFIDNFSTLQYVDYKSQGTIPDAFLPLMMKWMGFKVPSFFVDASIEQFIDAENIQTLVSTEQYSLQYVQNQLLRRVLTNIHHIIQSKGTQHSIKAFLRAVGIDPDNSLRIREYGGPTQRNLTYAREKKTAILSLLDFSGSGYLQTNYLSASRVEPGFPLPVGPMVQKNVFPPHGISNTLSDGYLTSGSWSFEGVYCYPPFRTIANLTQSLARLEATGSNTSRGGVICNLLAISSSNPLVRLYARPSAGVNFGDAPLLMMELSGADIFDGNRWNVSFGRIRNDATGSILSASWYLRAAATENGTLNRLYFTTASWFSEIGSGSLANNALQTRNVLWNVSGSFITLGSASLQTGATALHSFLNNTTWAPPEARVTAFEGQAGFLRFYSKGLLENEWREHIQNPNSLGVIDPLVNYNFGKQQSGSFERLRLDLNMQQDATDTDTLGRISLLDFSQNGYLASGSGFSASTQVLKPVVHTYSFLSPAFDEAATDEKVRIRSYQNYDNVQQTPWAAVAPVYRLNPSERPTDDARMSIEFSVIDALNRDIVNILGTLESLDNMLGNPELLFSPDYPSLEKLRDIYFNRLTDKINLKDFFTFYRWFSNSIGSFLEQLLPKRTRFLGTNYVVESHMLERAKLEYQYTDIYQSQDQRNPSRDTLLVQQVVGSVRKY